MNQLKKNIIQLTIIFLIFTFSINNVFAITANSSNYTTNLFGAGMATANSSSNNYNLIFLAEYKGTTRNAESGNYTGNIGFFPNTIYNRSVVITSYSISPTSATIGSTIGLFISALNYDSLWAVVTAPNSQEQTIILVNDNTVNFLPIPSIVGTYNVTFYANHSIGALATAVDSFELTAQEETETPSSGSGSGGICTYNWDCTPWSVCADGKQKRECKNIGTCTGTESKPIEEINCSEALFDITLKLKNINLTENMSLFFSYDLIEQFGVEKIDVHIKYSIIDEENNEIFSRLETRAIEGQLSIEQEIDEITFVDGKYTLRIDILYGNLQRAFSEQVFEVNQGIIILSPIKGKASILIFLIIAILIILILILIVLIMRYRRIWKIDALIMQGQKDVKKGKMIASGEKYDLLKDMYESRYRGNISIYEKIIGFYYTIINAFNKHKALSIAPILILLISFISLMSFDGRLTGLSIGNFGGENSVSLFTIGIILVATIIGLLIFFNREKIK